MQARAVHGLLVPLPATTQTSNICSQHLRLPPVTLQGDTAGWHLCTQGHCGRVHGQRAVAADGPSGAPQAGAVSGGGRGWGGRAPAVAVGVRHHESIPISTPTSWHAATVPPISTPTSWYAATVPPSRHLPTTPTTFFPTCSRDIKPANLLLGSQTDGTSVIYHLRLGDPGLVQAPGAPRELEGAPPGRCDTLCQAVLVCAT